MHIYFHFCGVVADVASLSRNHNYEYAHEFINESRRYARELSNGMEWKSKRARKFNALNCFVAPLQNWLKAKKIFCCAIHIRVHIAYRVLLCRTVAYTHTASQIGICYFALTHRIHFFLCRMCALFAWHIACMCIGVCVCALYTILFSNFNGCSVFFTHDFFRFFDDIFAQRFQV